MTIKGTSGSHIKVIIGLTLAILFLLIVGALTNVKKPKYINAPNYTGDTELNLIQLTFKEKYFNKIRKKQQKALVVGILETSDEDYVPAMVTYNGVNYRAEVRLKGDWVDHLEGVKWSFRVKLKGDQTIMGMRKFSIHHPKTRGYLGEWMFHKAAKKEKLIGMRYDFVEGVFHIKRENFPGFETIPVGVYAIEESFDKRTIESNFRKESVILKFKEDNFWNEVKRSLQIGNKYGLNFTSFATSMGEQSLLPIGLFGEEKSLADPVLTSNFRVAKNLLELSRRKFIPLEKAFDIEELAMQNALLNLMGGEHGMHLINVRFYFNPISSRLEPIAFDGNCGGEIKKYQHFKFFDKYKDELYMRALVDALEKVSEPTYLDSLEVENSQEYQFYKRVLQSEFGDFRNDLSNFRKNQVILKEELNRLRNELISQAKVNKIQIRDYGTLVATNLNLGNIDIVENDSNLMTLSRIDNKQVGYVRKFPSQLIPHSGRYTASMLIKLKSGKGAFGLRVQGSNSDRADALFDLNSGKVVGLDDGGDFVVTGAEIIPKPNGYYLIRIYSNLVSSNVSVVFGPADIKAPISGWEGPCSSSSEILIIPNSIKIN